jgi:hypothetical protein
MRIHRRFAGLLAAAAERCWFAPATLVRGCDAMTPSRGARGRCAALLAALILAGTPGPASACGYHLGLAAGFVTAHASSIRVAMAVGDAVAAGRLQPLADAPAPLALVRANGAMRTFAAVLDSGAEEWAPVALVLVEAHLWGRVTWESGGPRFAAHVNGPSGGDVIVVTGEPVLRALLEGRITWDAAIATGLVVVDGPPEARERIARLFVLKNS